jgi:hypothetical protein
MKQYSEELKAALVEKMLPPQNVPVGRLARETGIPKDTAHTLGPSQVSPGERCEGSGPRPATRALERRGQVCRSAGDSRLR